MTRPNMIWLRTSWITWKNLPMKVKKLPKKPKKLLKMLLKNEEAAKDANLF